MAYSKSLKYPIKGKDLLPCASTTLTGVNFYVLSLLVKFFFFFTLQYGLHLPYKTIKPIPMINTWIPSGAMVATSPNATFTPVQRDWYSMVSYTLSLICVVSTKKCGWSIMNECCSTSYFRRKANDNTNVLVRNLISTWYQICYSWKISHYFDYCSWDTNKQVLYQDKR